MGILGGEKTPERPIPSAFPGMGGGAVSETQLCGQPSNWVAVLLWWGWDSRPWLSHLLSGLFPHTRVTDEIFNFLLVWYYCTLTIRESILISNGSR